MPNSADTHTHTHTLTRAVRYFSIVNNHHLRVIIYYMLIMRRRGIVRRPYNMIIMSSVFSLALMHNASYVP